MDLELKGKRALVTGGSRGIGKAIARALAQEGADVALLARNVPALAAAAAELAAETGRKVVGVSADTTSDDQVRAAVAEAVRLLGGPIDILVNAAAEPAGYAGPPKLAEITGEFFHAEMDTKVMGYLRCAREVAPGMQAQGWGRIVNISGLAARQTGNTVGSMRNIAVAALTKNLADELGPAGHQRDGGAPGPDAHRAHRAAGGRARGGAGRRPPRRWKRRWRPATRSTTSSTPARSPTWSPSCARPSAARSTAT